MPEITALATMCRIDERQQVVDFKQLHYQSDGDSFFVFFCASSQLIGIHQVIVDSSANGFLEYEFELVGKAYTWHHAIVSALHKEQVILSTPVATFPSFLIVQFLITWTIESCGTIEIGVHDLL